MLYYHTDPQRQLVSEHVNQLAEEMRRSRRPEAEEPGYASWKRLAVELIQRVEPRRRRQAYRAAAYDV